MIGNESLGLAAELRRRNPFDRMGDQHVHWLVG